MRELIITEDGSHTIYVPELNEHYHSVHGAVQESTLVYVRNGLEYCTADPVELLEVGFGTGLNTLLSAFYSLRNKLRINYTAIEKYPLDISLLNKLNHYTFTANGGKELAGKIYNAPWDTREIINEYFTLEKIKSDLVNEKPAGSFNLIYFDAFGPDKQPEMWTGDVFEKVSSIVSKGCILVTYSSKGDVKRILKSHGFRIELLPGPPGKREMIRAIKL